MNWWHRLIGRSGLERDLDRELRYHLDRQVEDNIRAGLSPDEASRRARVQFGGLDQIKEACRDARGTRWLDDLLADLRYGSRLAVRDRSTTAIGVVALALGIGVSTTFFTVVNATCLRGLPIDRVDRVLYLGSRDTRGADHGLSYPDLTGLTLRTPALTGLAAFMTAPMTIADDRLAPERQPGAYISAAAFRLVHEVPLQGRDFQAADEIAGAPPVVILGGDVWKSRYGSDAALVGRTVRVNGTAATVVGIMREDFRFPGNAQVWLPLQRMPGLADGSGNDRALAVFGRLADGATIGEARGELDAAAAALARQRPATNQGIRFTAVPINDRYNARITDPVWLAFLTAALLVLLVACANVANLMLMRATERSHEIGVRLSLGATRLRLIRQLLAESGIVAAIGGLGGLCLSLVGARLLSVTLTHNVPYWLHFTLDGRVLLALAGVSTMSVFVFGLAPALHASRTDLNGALSQSRRTAAGGRHGRRWTAFFLTTEFALTTVLLAAVVSGSRSYRDALNGEIAIDSAHLLTSWVSLPDARYPAAQERLALYDAIRARCMASRLLSGVALTTTLPFGRGTERTVEVEGEAAAGDFRPTVTTVSVAGPYFRTLGLSMLRGRELDDRDGAEGASNVLVNDRLAAMYFPQGDPIGRRLRLGRAGSASSTGWLTIAGVAPTLRQSPQGLQPDPVVYLPLRLEAPGTVALVLRHAGDPEPLATVLKRTMQSLDPELPLYGVMTMDQVISESRLNGRVSEALITTISCIALVLAIVGLYGVTANSVAQRTREIGVRVALGAQPGRVTAMVLGRALKQLGFGLLAGVCCTFAWEYLLGDTAQRYRPTDPTTLVTVALVVIGVAMAACMLPARRAAGMEPVRALRQE